MITLSDEEWQKGKEKKMPSSNLLMNYGLKTAGEIQYHKLNSSCSEARSFHYNFFVVNKQS